VPRGITRHIILITLIVGITDVEDDLRAESKIQRILNQVLDRKAALRLRMPAVSGHRMSSMKRGVTSAAIPPVAVAFGAHVS
jgi:hypothetical protein